MMMTVGGGDSTRVLREQLEKMRALLISYPHISKGYGKGKEKEILMLNKINYRHKPIRKVMKVGSPKEL